LAMVENALRVCLASQIITFAACRQSVDADDLPLVRVHDWNDW
jgi:hypothetical protein